MEEKTKLDILEHAKKEFPRECCGLIIIEKGHEVYVPCGNNSRPNESFVMDTFDYISAEARGKIISIVHSHCNVRAKPTEIDLTSCETTKLPWHIVSLPNEEWAYFQPSGYKASLFGRPYHYGVLDCYTLVVDWYRQVKGIKLNEHLDREDNWWEKGKNLFLEKFQEDGFRKVKEDEKLEEGDVILMQIGKAKVPTHVGIYLEPNLLLHHYRGRYSTRDVYGGWYRKHTRCAFRYMGVSS